MRRVVITGLGLVAPPGNTVDAAWRTVLEGRSAVAPIERFDASQLPVTFAAEVRGFDPTTVMSLKEARQTTDFIQFSAGAAREAVRDSGLDTSLAPHRYGCVVGVGLGAFGAIEEGAQKFVDSGPRRVSPLLLPYAIPNMAAGYVSIQECLQGPCFAPASACASGTHALGEAYLHVAMGMADAIVAGGAEAATTPLSISAFARMKALSSRNDDPSRASRPFDRDRDGFVMGEGSGMLVLEDYEHARQRGARIYAEMIGYGATADGYHITSPPPEGTGAARCMDAALRSARIDPSDVDYINAHGTSTQANDAFESAAIETVFGEHAARVAISSTKGVTGHCLGAAGAIEAVLTILAIRDSAVPPTANLENADPECRLDYTPGAARERRIRCALSNSCGFGGQNATVIFRQL